MGSAYSSLVFLPPQPSYTPTAPWLSFVPGTAAKGQKVPVMLFTRGASGLMESGLGDRTLLYCHGNAEDIGQGAQLYAEISASLGCNVVAYDYAGYGLNSLESPSEAACYADVEAVAKWVLEELRVSPENLFVYVLLAAPSSSISLRLALYRTLISEGQYLADTLRTSFKMKRLSTHQTLPTQ